MAKADKIVEKMKRNRRDWTIADFEVVARKHRLILREGKGSHTVFMSEKESLPVPAKRPIKPIYVKQFLRLLGD